jgi:hypothetical protein
VGVPGSAAESPGMGLSAAFLAIIATRNGGNLTLPPTLPPTPPPNLPPAALSLRIGCFLNLLMSCS